METQKIDIAVVILNWNGQQWLKKFLPTVIEKSSMANIYIADNASTDDSVSFLEDNFDSVKIIQNQLNEETIFYDLSYGKASANFFSWASQFSKNRFDGTGMLIAQAAFSFQLWFDTFPDTSNIKLSNADD